MIDIKDKKECCGCAACVQRCPKRCISLQEDGEGFFYPKADASLCIDCSLCEKVCPVINQGEAREPLAVYAAKNPNEDIRRQSSSGGIFTMLAEYIIDKGGVVFGAAFDAQWEVEHQYTETKDGLAAFRGSKYMQSRIGETFKQAEAFLKEGREVLFSGTPCQIAGLNLFLRKKYENLVTVEVVCHGAPSPKVWGQYLREKTAELKSTPSQVEGVNFREKSTGWKTYTFALSFRHNEAYEELAAQNIFMRGFLADLYLRPACHACPAKSFKSGSDITLGDYWGIETLMPELDDDRGVSAIAVNTPKGETLLSEIIAELHETSCRDFMKGNPALYNSCAVPRGRTAFFEHCGQTVAERVEELTRRTLLQRIKGRLAQCLPQGLVDGLKGLLGRQVSASE